jgi:hypothetical protein
MVIACFKLPYYPQTGMLGLKGTLNAKKLTSCHTAFLKCRLVKWTVK